jgi:DNA-binding LytR/AlgR family response regulator
MASILIVEDEVLIANQLKNYLVQAGHTCCGHATSYEEAVDILASEDPDLVLLDIRLYGERTGIDLAHYINTNSSIPFIYLTSHFEKSTLEDAKATRPAGFLTKPYQAETLITTIEICLFNFRHPADKSERIEISEGKKTHLFYPEEILFMESEHVYTRIVLDDRSVLIRKGLNEIGELLINKLFIRVHKSFIVNLAHIRQVSATTILVKDIKIPIGKTFKSDVHNIINSREGSIL